MRQLLERSNRFLETPLSLAPRVLLAIAACALALTLTQPLWNMTMFAPQYGNGLRLDIHTDGLRGGNRGQDLKEINLLNHYIGMRDLSNDDFTEFQWMPFVIGGLALLFLRAAVHGRVSALVDSLVLFVYFGAFSLWSFAWCTARAANRSRASRIESSSMARAGSASALSSTSCQRARRRRAVSRTNTRELYSRSTYARAASSSATVIVGGPEPANYPREYLRHGADVVVRFHYYNANWEWWWQIDDVRIGQASPSRDVVGVVAHRSLEGRLVRVDAGVYRQASFLDDRILTLHCLKKEFGNERPAQAQAKSAAPAAPPTKERHKRRSLSSTRPAR